MTSRVYVLTIYYPDWVCESDRSLAHTILRRRSDGPLIVREHERGPSQHPKDWGKLRYTSHRPTVQALFPDWATLCRAQQDLHTCVPHMPEGMVRFERRRTHYPELPCTCVLPEARAIQMGIPVFPHYSQVADCKRHAHLLARSCSQHLMTLVQQQAGDVMRDLPATPHPELPLTVDELPTIHRSPSTSAQLATLATILARDGRKVALYG